MLFSFCSDITLATTEEEGKFDGDKEKDEALRSGSTRQWIMPMRGKNRQRMCNNQNK